MLNLMKLEQRIVLDGAAVAGIIDHDAEHHEVVAGETSHLPADTDTAHVAEAVALLSEPNSNAEPLEVVLVSDALPDYQQLTAAAHPNARVIVFDADAESAADVLGRVTQLSKETGRPIESVSILSHGGNGSFRLGTEAITSENLNENAEAWAALDKTLSEHGRIYLFGCGVAGGTGKGQALLDGLAEATGAQVFASDDITGKGGDWDLEAASKGADPNSEHLPFDMALLSEYAGKLIDNFPIEITTMEDEPGSFGIYFWGTGISQNTQIALSIATNTTPPPFPLQHVALYDDGWITDRPIVIEGHPVAQYHRFSLDYQPILEQVGTASLSFNLSINGVPQSYATAVINILPVNDPPIAEDLHLVTPEDTPIPGDVEGSDVEDPPALLRFQIQNGPSHGTVTNWDPTTGNFIYTPNQDYNGPDSFTFTVIDTGGLTDTGTVTIDVTPVPDPPIVTPSDGQMCYYENSAPKPVDTGIVINDPDSDIMSGAVVRIAQNYQNDGRGKDYLRYDNMNGITGTYNDATATLTLTGNASKAAYQQALRSVRFEHVGDNPIEGTRTVTFSVTDDTGLSAQGSRVVMVDAINDAPGLGPKTDDVIEYDTLTDKPVVISDNFDISDIDDERMTGAVVRITTNYQQGGDVLGFQNVAGITGTWNAGTGTLTLAGSATIAQYEAALSSVTYANVSANPTEGVRTISFTVTDANSRGDGSGICSDAPAGGPMSAEVAFRTVVVIVDHPPHVINDDGQLCYPEKHEAMVLDGTVVIEDVDSTNMTGATLKFTSNYKQGEDVLIFQNTAHITGSWNASTGTLTLAGTASTAEYTQALRAVRYHNEAGDKPTEGQRIVTFTVTDDQGLTGQDTRIVFVDAINDAPVMQPVNLAWQYKPGDGKAALASSITLTDVDDDVMTGAVIRIQANYQAGEDVLSFTNTAHITGTWNAGTGTLTLSGTAPIAEYQAAIRSVTYENLLQKPTESVRTITFTVTDANGGGDGIAVCADAGDQGAGGPLSATSTSQTDVGEKEPNKDPGEIPTPLGPPGPNPATPTEMEGPDDVLEGGRYDGGMPIQTFETPGYRGIDRSGPGDEILPPDICSIDHALQAHLGCRFAKADNYESKIGSVRWSDLGWERPLLDEEYDLFTKLFLREAGDKGFNIELGALAQLGGISQQPQVFAPSNAEDFNDMGPGDLREAFFQNKPKEWDKTQRGWPGER